MSKLNFMLNYGSLEDAKKAIANSDKNRWGHFTAMDKLLDRMKDEGDPDYTHVLNNHMHEFLNNPAVRKLAASHLAKSKHATPEHLKTAYDVGNIGARLNSVKNPNADAAFLDYAYKNSFGKDEGLGYDYDTKMNILQHPKASVELLRKMTGDQYFPVRDSAQHILKMRGHDV